MNQKGPIAEDPVFKDHIVVSEFTSKEWNNKASFSMSSLFGFSAAFGVMGIAVALILMIFLPDMRSLFAAAVFSVVFGLIFGFMYQKAEQSRGRTFLADLSTKINITLTELGGNELQNITPSQLKELINSKKDYPVTVDGVGGLRLMVVSDDRSFHIAVPPAAATTAATVAVAKSQQAGKSRPNSKRWRVLIATEAPQYGTESFDRLLGAVTPKGGREQ